MALLSSIDESTFTELSKRFHQKLKQQHNLTLSLGQFRELMIQAVGHRSLHDARKAWQGSPTAPDPETPFMEAPVAGSFLDKAQQEALTHDLELMAYYPARPPEQGNLLFWEEIGISEPGTRDNPHPTPPGGSTRP